MRARLCSAILLAGLLVCVLPELAIANEEAPISVSQAQSKLLCICSLGPKGPSWIDAPAVSERAGILQLARAAADATPTSRVRIAYLIPSNRTPQTNAVARIRDTMRHVQNFYRDQMQKHGYGSRTFTLETDADAVTSQVHVVKLTETDSALRGSSVPYNQSEQWSNVLGAATRAGLTIWARNEVWVLIPETHAQLESGEVIGNVFLGAGFERAGDSGGVCMMGSNALAALQSVYFIDDRPFGGLRIPELGPYPMTTIVGSEGLTLSTASTSIIGGLAHELGHSFGLAHDMRNDQNFRGNLEGNGLRGMRGNLFPGRYPTDYVELTDVAARALSVSPYFGAPADNSVTPTIETALPATVRPEGGFIAIPFTARAATRLALSFLQDSEGNIVADMPLSGASASATYVVSSFTPNATNSYRIFVYDVNGNRKITSVSVPVGDAAVRAPRPFSRIARPIAVMDEEVQLDASPSTDPVYRASELRVEWDLNGDGIFDTAPTTTKTIMIRSDRAGTRRVLLRVTNPALASAISAPVFVYVEPAPLGQNPSPDGKMALEWTGSLGFIYQVFRSTSSGTDWSDAGLPLYVGTGVRVTTIASAASSAPASFKLVPLKQNSLDTSAPVIVAAPIASGVKEGDAVSFAVLVAGSGPLAYQWQRNGVPISGATGSILTLGSARIADAGSYSVTVTNTAASSTSTAASLTVSPIGSSRLANLSVRSVAGIGDQTLIVGFAIDGSGTKQILLRGIGPTLSAFGVAEPLADPELRLFDGSVEIAQNNDWSGSEAMSNAFSSVGAFALPANSRDAAMLVPLPAKAYSAHVAARSGNGVALVEVYDADIGTPAMRLTNMSARNHVGTGANILIVGFAVSGNASKRLLIRGLGPTLAQFGVGGHLADPQIILSNANNATLEQNDDWSGSSTLSAAFSSVGAFPLPPDSKDAAFLVTLQSGTYTVQVTGVNSTAGVALVEVYEMP